MIRRIPSFFSYALHPAVIPTLGLYLILQADLYLKYAINDAYKWTLLALVFTNTFLFPLILVLLLYNRKIISNIRLTERTERFTPYAFTSFFYLFTYYLLKKSAVSPLILSLFFGSMLSVLVLFLINFKWKISAHMIGISGLVGGIVAIYLKFQAPMGGLIVLTGLLWGILGYSRIVLKAHNPYEVYLGSCIGLVCVGFSVYLGWG